MKITQYVNEIINELSRTADSIRDEEAEVIVNAILQAGQIFVAGAGRSGLMAKSFAMRLMHLGVHAYVIGETITPGLKHGDLLIIASGSGETKSLVSMAKKAKSLGGIVGAVTIFPESTIGKLSQMAVKLPGAPKDKTDSTYKTIQPMGTLFEQTLLLFFDAVVLRLMERQGIHVDAMYARHANLE